MKVRLELEAPVDGEYFGISRPVRGRTILQLSHSTAISSITVCLTGTMMTRMLDPRFGWKKSSDDDLIDSHEFCEASEIIFPRVETASVRDGFTLPQGAHSYAFEISFPPLTSCKESDDEIKHLVTIPPPTFENTFPDRRGIGKVSYVLKVNVRRPERWRRNCSTEQILNFRPPNPSLSSIFTNFQYSVVSVALESENLGSDTQQHRESSSGLSLAPILVLEARLPSPAVLYTGERPPLRLLIRRFSTPSNELPSAELRTLAIYLVSTISIKAELSRIAWDASRTLLDRTGLQVLLVDALQQENSESFEVNSSLLDGLIIPREVAPSFTTCTIRQDHALRVIAGFSIAGEEKLRLVEATINMEIHSGMEIEPRSLLPPEYDMGSQSLLFPVSSPTPADASRVPLRQGCLQHLGLNNINNSLANAALQPPAYGIS